MKIKSLKQTTIKVPGWLEKRFGDCFAQISTNTMLRIKSSIKDVHRVLHGRVSPEIEMLCKKIPIPPQGLEDYDFVFGYEDSNGNHVQGIADTDPTLKLYIEKFPKEWDVVRKCLGLTRQKSRHACAYVIADEPIKNFIPLTTVGGFKVTQYTSSSVEAVGGLKMDFLVINSLNDIAGALKLIRNRQSYRPKTEKLGGVDVPGIRVVPFNGQLYDVWDLPEDQDVFREICQGKTETVFQFNTNSARQWLREFLDEDQHALKSVEGLAAFTALDRPGPLDATVTDGHIQRNMLQEFAARARGEKPIGANRILDKMLPETYGIIVYQEQLQRVFQEIGGTTGIQANQFRDDIGKKRMAKVMAWKDVFMPGAIQKLGPEEAQRLWDMMETFGQYGFNKSHSVCYVIIGYACAWLKHHFPLEWWAAVLSNADRNEIEEKFWPYCGHLIDLPDIKLSGEGFEIQNERIRAPLWLLKGIGPTAHAELCEERPYSDVNSFCQKLYDRRVRKGTKTPEGKLKLARSAITRPMLSKLIVSGVADSLFPEGTALHDKFPILAEAERVASGAKRAKAFDTKILELQPLERFQMKKGILPCFDESLVPMVARLKDLPFLEVAGQEVYIKTTRGFATQGKAVKELDYKFRCLSGRDIERLWAIQDIPPPLKIGAIAYVGATRPFTYAGGSKKACEIDFEIDGYRFKSVRWPDKNGDLDLPDDLKGSIIAVTFVKFSEGRPFGIDDIYVVRGPLNLKDEVSSP